MNSRKKILFICGSLNQTTQMHKIASYLAADFDCYFTAFYCNPVWYPFQKMGLLDWTIIGGQNRDKTERYFKEQGLKVDYRGQSDDYDLVLTCTDLLVQNNIKNKPVILVQEGMTDPENLAFLVVKYFRKLGVPRWIASTSTTGLSDAYVKFCVASEGYRRHFVNKGVREEKVVVTGIPNFDNVKEFEKNDFPYRDHVLVATTDTRENFKWDNRKAFLRKVRDIASGRQVVFRLHPNENHRRSTREILQIIPTAVVYTTGNTSEMIANCHTLVTQYSSVAYIGLALGKQVHSYFDVKELKELCPIQNGGTSAQTISEVCREVLQ